MKIENSDFNNWTKQELFDYIVVLRKALDQPVQEPDKLSDELAEVLIALKGWVVDAENRLNRLEKALKEKR
jgi:hypothetical protein